MIRQGGKEGGGDVLISTLSNQTTPCIHLKCTRRSVNGSSAETVTTCGQCAEGKPLGTGPGRLKLSL